MKNIAAVCAIMALLFAPSVSNARWGTDFTGESWKMDGKEFLTSMHSGEAYAADPSNSTSMTGKVTQDKIGGAASFFVEGNSRFRVGISAGYGTMPEVSGKFRAWGSTWSDNMNLNNKITYIPVNLYLKYTSKNGKFSLFGGGGGDYVMASTDYNDALGSPAYVEKATFTQKKMIPHIQAGYELFLAKWISLNLGAKYLFSAVLDNMTGKLTGGGVPAPGKSRMIMSNGLYGEEFGVRNTSQPLASGERPFKYDLSGLRVNVGFRIYFN